MPGFQFKIEIHQSNPKIWRRIIVPSEYTFYKFHLAIQGAFGWGNYHLFQFSENGFLDKVSYAELLEESNDDPEFVTKDARRTKIKKVFVKHKHFKYIYDMGDKWEHNIKFEEVVEREIERPYCSEGGGACPPEDSGGLGGYAAIVESLNTPGHPEREEFIEWLGLLPREKWDVNFCSVREVNKRLCLLE
jgi:hypothetical protein